MKNALRVCLALLLALMALPPALGLPETRLSAQAASSPTIRIGVLKNGAYEIVSLPLETYVARVLAGEALPGSAPAAMEALAIAVRTYTIDNLGRHRGDGFDLCDQTHCQVMRQSSLATERAAAATADQVLMYRGQVATIYYSASCGGHTEKPSNVWPGAEDPPYLPSRTDDGCGGSPAWSTQLSLRDLQRALNAAGYRGTLRDMRVASRNDSGRAQQLQLDGLTPSRISGQDLRVAVGRTIGWQYIQSTNFELSRSGDAIRMRGQGSGHGVGMCVIGASRLATNGRTSAQILQQYYPGTTMGAASARMTNARPGGTSAAPATSSVPPATARPNASAPVSPPPTATAAPAPPTASPAAAAMTVGGGSLAIELPEAAASERAAITTLVARERDAMAASLGVAPPARLTLRFHSTTDAFQASTGAAWFVLGTTTGSDLDFVPIESLRDRGMLERTVRRQLVRAMTASALAGRPAWVREGAALHFAEGTNAPERRDPCPQDIELLRPSSVGALSDAYSRARACFERQLSGGKKWSEIR